MYDVVKQYGQTPTISKQRFKHAPATAKATRHTAQTETDDLHTKNQNNLHTRKEPNNLHTNTKSNSQPIHTKNQPARWHAHRT